MKTPTVENCELPDLEELSRILAEELKNDVPHILDTFKWPTRRKTPNGDDIFKLKKDKSVNFSKIKEKDIAKKIAWVESVLHWGRIFKNSRESLELYANLNNPLPCKNKGIASWSKILAFRFPAKYFIYDYRVAFSLNYILATHYNKLKYNNYFYIPPSQRKDAKPCREKLVSLLKKPLKNKHFDLKELSRLESYDIYLKLIEKTAKKFNLKDCDKQKIEMALFMKFEYYTKAVAELP